MIICGLQKLTLLDYPEKTACTIFTGGCNFRCPFCHNASLVVENNFEETITEADLFAFLNKRKKVLDGVCITGGEPLIHKDVDTLISKIKEIGYLVKLDTNGGNPKMLKSLVERNLIDYVAMDVKNSPENYALTCGLENIDFQKIKESIDFLKSGKIDFEFRTTAVNGIHTKDDFLQIAKLLQGNEKYFIQNYMDSGDVLASRDTKKINFSSFSDNQINEFISIVKPFVPNVKARG